MVYKTIWSVFPTPIRNTLVDSRNITTLPVLRKLEVLPTAVRRMDEFDPRRSRPDLARIPWLPGKLSLRAIWARLSRNSA